MGLLKYSLNCQGCSAISTIGKSCAAIKSVATLGSNEIEVLDGLSNDLDDLNRFLWVIGAVCNSEQIECASYTYRLLCICFLGIVASLWVIRAMEQSMTGEGSVHFFLLDEKRGLR